jgi:hypothetical protein
MVKLGISLSNKLEALLCCCIKVCVMHRIELGSSLLSIKLGALLLGIELGALLPIKLSASHLIIELGIVSLGI